jgi:class 3 adenylate cyclase
MNAYGAREIGGRNMNDLVQVRDVARAPRRRLSALAFLDVVDYSRLVAMNEEATLDAWSNLRRTVVEPEIVAWRGRVVDRAGDGIFAEFGSALEMLRWALSVQDVARSYQSGTVTPLRFRIALHLTDVFDGPDGSVSGDGVNVTARLHAAAEAGGVVVSQSIYDAVQGKVDVDFLDLGDLHLKNLPNPVHAFRIGRLPDAGRSAGSWWRPMRMTLGVGLLSALMVMPALTTSSGARQTAQRLLNEGLAIKCPSFPCGPETLQKRALYKQAIQADPSFARPYAEEALTYSDLVAARMSADEKDDLRIAAGLATQAVVLAPNDPLSHNARANVLRQNPDTLEASLTAYQRALALDPKIAFMRANAGWVLLLLGRPEEAEVYLKSAIAAKPNTPSIAAWLNRVGLAELFLDHKGHGADYFSLAISKQSPVEAQTDVGLERSINLASALALNGDVEGGHRVIERLQRQYPVTTTKNIFTCVCSNDANFQAGMAKLRRGAIMAGVLDDN